MPVQLLVWKLLFWNDFTLHTSDNTSVQYIPLQYFEFCSKLRYSSNTPKYSAQQNPSKQNIHHQTVNTVFLSRSLYQKSELKTLYISSYFHVWLVHNSLAVCCPWPNGTFNASLVHTRNKLNVPLLSVEWLEGGCWTAGHRCLDEPRAGEARPAAAPRGCLQWSWPVVHSVWL